MTGSNRVSDKGISPALVADAQKRLASVISSTPVLRDTPLDGLFGCHLFIQCENRQATGAFKYRGASNAILGLLQAGTLKAGTTTGVCTHSSGNHGKALARAARLNGVSAEVVAPENSVATKLAAMRAEEAVVHLCAPTQAAREAGVATLIAKGLIPIPPYDHPLVIAGQGTWALEILEQFDQLDILLIPVGGGGLAAGTILACNLFMQRTGRAPVVIGAEPEQADDCWRSLQLGQRVQDHQPDTIADGLRAMIGKLTFPIIQAGIADVLRVSEASIEAAIKLAGDYLEEVIEPSSATVLAALLEYPEVFSGHRVGLILTGGNVAYE
ncbi:MAG: threonine/serine dehydratase [Proteobacteria bacterium]|nr:threonine/serine dehydratase [Pseudomonadota bacterium]